LFFSKFIVFDEMKPQVAPVDQIHDEVEIFSILECIERVD
jgi:hypothetical protein